MFDVVVSPHRRNRQLLWILLYGCMPVLLLYASSRPGSSPWLLERATAVAVGEVQVVRQSIFDGLSALWRDYVALVDVSREIEAVKGENARLRMANRRFAALAAENARLRQMLRFRDRTRTRFHLLPAKVIAKDTSPFFRVVRLSLGVGSDKVQTGQAVVTTEGVVGQVQRVYGEHADVRLVSDARSAIDVVVQQNRARGILKGIGSSEHYRTKIEYLLRTDEVNKGDLVVTSGMGGRYPKDLSIGKVIRVERRQYGLYQQVEVEPSVDFSRLEHAYVIVDEPPPAESDVSAEPTAAP